jgi:hypothetical protein
MIRITGQAPLERLAQHEARLRQRALGGVDEQGDRVDHDQPALDLAAEVRVPGRVDDVELRLAQRTAVFFARMVMPFSRSRSIESMTRSLTSWLARKRPPARASRRPASSCRGRRGR